MKINVTKSDIKKGIRFECDKCPVALAIKRATKKKKKKSIGVLPGILFYGENTISLPDNVRDFIYDFDAKRIVEPFSFNLNIK